MSTISERIDDFTQRLEDIRRHLDPPRKQEELKTLYEKREAPNFWNDRNTAQSVIDKITIREKPISLFKSIESALDDSKVLFELAEEEDDENALNEVSASLDALEKKFSDFEFQLRLGGRDDSKNVILSINAGAGGTESQDWAQMLLRMYIRWIERKEFSYEEYDLQPGQEAGIKSVTILVKGDYAYGYLKSENGVHRLVRISPFDSNSRRHTSFASVTVLPEIGDNAEIDIDEKDLKIDVYRASGAGGQHVNKTSSAVRITHTPTGIVVQCQNERSQFKNKSAAMKVLKSRLYQLQKEEEEKKQAEYTKDQKKIEWGSQIRSYVFHPYNMVKDLRTEAETSNVQAVMDGDIDLFINSYLSHHES
ncbi:peptide chain release factor 2 [Candidatus Latescibacterota bacterium]